MADHPSRKLAVILHADVVGSTELVQHNESVAHERMQQTFRRFSETITAYGGTPREIRGDALVAEFARASDAVTAAIGFQIQNTDSNAQLEGDIQPKLRIGISLGEVVVADNTITGAGVVLAQRLEQLADPGGVVVQGSVSETVPNRLPFYFGSLGEQTLKGFNQPVRAFTVRLKEGEQIPDAESNAVTAEIGTHEQPPLELPDKPSIVVLPFTNMSSDPEQEYFSDGVSEDIITDLSKMSELFVIARNSAFAYKGEAPNIPNVCRDLGVRFALEGSIRKAGNRVRITAQLIDGTTGGHVWAERYDRELADIFAVQDEVTRKIVSALAPKLTEAKQQLPTRQPTDNLEAYDYFLRGREQWWRLTKQANAEARSMFERAIQLDPNFATAHAWLAGSHLVDCVNQWSESSAQSARLHSELARRAVALDDQDSFAHVQLGMACLFAGQHELAIAEGKKAITLDPNFAHARFDLAWFLNYAGKWLEALDMLDEAVRLDPHFPDMILHLRAVAYFHLGRYEDAVAALKRRLTRNPNTDVSHVLLAACYGHLGRCSEARAEWREALRVNPNYSLEHRQKVLPYKNPDDFKQIVDGLRKASVKGIDTIF